MQNDSIQDHLRDLVRLATADANFDPRELSLLLDIGEKHGLGESEVRQLIAAPPRVADRPRVPLLDAVDRLYDLARMALADGVVRDEEVAVIASLATRMGIPDDMSSDFASGLISDVRDARPKSEILSEIESQLKDGQS